MKQRVHYSELEDMKKYIKEFNPENYLSCIETTDPAVTAYVRDYYDSHLPVDATAWLRVNIPDEKLIFAKGCTEQVVFVRDTLSSLLRATYEEYCNNPPMVISTHYSKSVKLPVFQIELEKYGIEMVLRHNFYNWIVSVKSDAPLDCDFMNIFDYSKEIPYYYCEGFSRDKVYGSYNQSHSQFTIDFNSKYELYTFIFILKNYLGIRR